MKKLFRWIRIKRKRGNRASYLKHKERARHLVHQRLLYFNQFYNFTYHKVAIRNQRTRWGSCSKHGNLNFNYKLALIPESLANYVIVHEICHLGEFNHSRNFWDLVEKTIPDYVKCREDLKKINSEYFKNYTESTLD
jgi:predicted metal-dependent hydrolase